MSFLELARSVVVQGTDTPRRGDEQYEVNAENEVSPAVPRIWLCARCDLPRSLGSEPCPNCRSHGVEQRAGRWFHPCAETMPQREQDE